MYTVTYQYRRIASSHIDPRDGKFCETREVQLWCNHSNPDFAYAQLKENAKSGDWSREYDIYFQDAHGGRLEPLTPEERHELETLQRRRDEIATTMNQKAKKWHLEPQKRDTEIKMIARLASILVKLKLESETSSTLTTLDADLGGATVGGKLMDIWLLFHDDVKVLPCPFPPC